MAMRSLNPRTEQTTSARPVSRYVSELSKIYRKKLTGFKLGTTRKTQPKVLISGVWWKGKAEVFGILDRYHKTIFKDRKLYPAEKLAIRQIAPNVIVSTMINPADAYTNSSGIIQPQTRNVLTLVWVRREDKWLIAQAQNTIEAPAGPPPK